MDAWSHDPHLAFAIFFSSGVERTNVKGRVVMCCISTLLRIPHMALSAGHSHGLPPALPVQRDNALSRAHCALYYGTYGIYNDYWPKLSPWQTRSRSF